MAKETANHHQEARQERNLATLMFLKPGYDRLDIQDILESEIKKRSLSVAKQGGSQFNPEKTAELYQHHQGKPWFKTHARYIASKPVHYWLVTCSEEIVIDEFYRQIRGIVKTLRDKFGRKNEKTPFRKGVNVIHGSGSPEEALRELEILALNEVE